MENNQLNKGESLAAAKKKNTHLLISLGIVGAGLLVALIIGIVILVGGFGNGINGKSPEKLHDDFCGTVVDSNNYTVVSQKTANGALTQAGENLNVEITEEARRDGNNVFYRKMKKIVYKSTSKSVEQTITSITEITVIDGVAYVSQVENGAVVRMKRMAVSSDYEGGKKIIDALLWDFDGLFEDSDIKKVGDGYKVSVDNQKFSGDKTFKNFLRANVIDVYNEAGTDKGTFFAFFVSDAYDYEYNYDVTYDGKGSPSLLEYEYVFGNGNFFVGSVGARAEITYGSSDVSLPQNPDQYQWNEAN